MLICSALDVDSAIWLIRSGQVDFVLIPGVETDVSLFAHVDPLLAEDLFKLDVFRGLIPKAVGELPSHGARIDHGPERIPVAYHLLKVSYDRLFKAFLTPKPLSEEIQP